MKKPDTITLVGCGFLGGLFAVELAKRMYGLDLLPQKLHLIDYDVVEDRNTANQVFGSSDISNSKTAALSYILAAEQEALKVEVSEEKLTEENATKLLEGSIIIVDALDNIEARHNVWYWAQEHGVPILHLGVSQDGNGRVEWSTEDYETWSLSPLALAGRRLPPPDPEVLPPCELITFRGLGLNMAVAGAKAFSIWAGFDPEHTLETDLRQGMKLDDAGTMTDWTAHNGGHELFAVCPDEARWTGPTVVANEDTDEPEEAEETEASKEGEE